MATFQKSLDRSYTLEIQITESSYSIENNTSTVAWSLVLKSGSYSFSQYRVGWSVSLGGAVVSSRAWDATPSNYQSLSANSSLTIASGTETLTHNNDGTLTVSVSGSLTMPKGAYGPFPGSSGTGTATASGSFSLTTIPRASTMTYSSSMTMGTSTTFTINRASSSFTHTLKYAFGTLSNQSIGTGIGASKSWTPPTSLGSQIPSANSGTITFTLQTYSGSTLIGTKTYTATLNVPSYTPTATLTTTLNNSSNSTVAGWGVAVKGITKINYSISGSTSYGASVSTYEAIISASGETKSTQTGTSSVVTNTGNTTVKARIKDSRNKWSSQATNNITVYNYNPPKITSCSVYRCNQDGTKNTSGTYLRLYCVASIGSDSSIGNRNSISISYNAGGNTGTLTSGTASIIGTFSVDQTYNVSIVATDTVGSYVERTFKIPTELVTMHMKEGGTGVAFSTYSTIDDAVDFGTWSPIGAVVGLNKAKERIQSANLNDYTTPGVYSIYQDNDVPNISNCPSSYAGTLRVWNALGWGSLTATDVYLVQQYFDRKADVWIRYITISSGTPSVGTWKKITTTTV